MLLGREIDAMDPNDNYDAAKLARCVGEQERATAAIDDQIAALLNDDRLAAVQLAACVNLLVIVLLADSEWHGHHTLMQLLLALFPVGWAVEFAILVFMGPVLRANSREEIMRWASFFVLCAALIGSVLIAADPDHVIADENSKQALAGLTVFMLITRNVYFSKIVFAFCRALTVAVPILIAILMFVMMFALATCDIFGAKVVSEDQNPYFNSNSKSLTSLFRLFISAAWHEIVLRAAAATTEAAFLWFYTYMFLVSVFCSELLIGVIIAQYISVTSIKSAGLGAVLAPIFDSGPSDHDAVLTGILILNRNCGPYNCLYAALEERLLSANPIDGGCALLHATTTEAEPNVQPMPHSEYMNGSHLLSVTGLFDAVLQDLDCRTNCSVQHSLVIAHFDTSIDLLWSAFRSQLLPVSDEEVTVWRTRCCKALCIWLEAIVAGICAEGIWQAVSRTQDPVGEARKRLQHFESFGMTSYGTQCTRPAAFSGQWQEVLTACHNLASRVIGDLQASTRAVDQIHNALELDQVRRQSTWIRHWIICCNSARITEIRRSSVMRTLLC